MKTRKSIKFETNSIRKVFLILYNSYTYFGEQTNDFYLVRFV